MPSDRGLAPRARIIRWTGHPPPLQQIAGQVRTSAGFSSGVPTAAGARALSVHRLELDAPERGSPVDRLIACLRRLAAVRRPLPSATRLAILVGLDRANLYRALRQAAAAGRLTWRSIPGKADAWAVRLSGSDTVLRSRHFPPEQTP